MFAVTVKFAVDPERAEEFRALVRRNAADSLREEPGCRRFDVCTNADRPGDVFLYELYDDRAAFDAHAAMAHFRAFDAASADMVRSKEVATYAEVHP